MYVFVCVNIYEFVLRIETQKDDALEGTLGSWVGEVKYKWKKGKPAS